MKQLLGFVLDFNVEDKKEGINFTEYLKGIKLKNNICFN